MHPNGMCFIILPVHRNSWCCEEFVDAERCYVVMEKFEAIWVAGFLFDLAIV